MTQAGRLYIKTMLGEIYLLEDGSHPMGRDRDSDGFISLGDASVSRNHAVLTLTRGRLSLRDLGSSNGTFYKGARLVANREQPLQPGEAFELGGMQLRVYQWPPERAVEGPAVPRLEGPPPLPPEAFR